MTPLDEERLMNSLRHIAAVVDPVPEVVLESARAALSLRRLDAELVELVRDSSEHHKELAGVRGEGDVRMLSFEFPPVSVDVQVTERGEQRDLVAHVSGTDLRTARWENESSHRDLDVDDGVLIADEVPTGLMRLHLDSTDGRAYTTSWVRV